MFSFYHGKHFTRDMHPFVGNVGYDFDRIRDVLLRRLINLVVLETLA